MEALKNIVVCLILYAILFLSSKVYAQQPTYTVDPDFNTGGLFRDGSPVLDFHIMNDGRYLVAGSFEHYQSPVTGFGMIFSNGSWDDSFQTTIASPSKIIVQEDGYVYPFISSYGKLTLEGPKWGAIHGDFWSEYLEGGTSSPYNVKRAWDIYQMENGDLLIGGAIATDTLQPGLFRGITRIHADGSHDPTFPILNITPNNASGAVRKIFIAPDSSWYISGSFTAINGHETNHVARLTSDFEVDTNFVSPFMYDGPVDYTEDIELVDILGRIWVSGFRMRLLANPNDTIQLCRLSPDGTIDTAFPLTKLKSVYPDSWMTWRPSHARVIHELEAYPGNYLVFGSFSHYNNILQPCITVINDFGIIQNNFFQSQGATEHKPFENIDGYIYPSVNAVEELDNGDLLVGGAFSEFMGQTHHSVVKLKHGFVGVEERNQKVEFNLYPNPAVEKLLISQLTGTAKWGVIFNALGRQVLNFSFENSETEIDISKLNPGIYFVKIQLETGEMSVRKFVKPGK